MSFTALAMAILAADAAFCFTQLYPEQPSFMIVLAMFLLADLCPSFTQVSESRASARVHVLMPLLCLSQFFMLRILRALGRNAFSIYLLHGPTLYTIS